jgi:formylglycine-generating enzyme required for sulfatase activity
MRPNDFDHALLNRITCLLIAGIWAGTVSVCLAQGSVISQVFTNSIGMEFVHLSAGSFTVGAFHPPFPVPADTVKGATRPLNMYMGEGSYSASEFALAQTLAQRDSRDGFVVKIKKDFWMGRFEVTQAQWKKVMGTNPSTFSGAGSDQLPVENVSWADAQAFIARLNQLDRGRRYRLPSEFEWEYAARAGATDDISWPAIEKTANLNKTHTIAVGQKQPNAWDLYDMLGNVWEWVDDFYNEKIFADRRPRKQGEVHVLKGASFVGDVKNATYMTHAGGPGNGWDVGFRILFEQR